MVYSVDTLSDDDIHNIITEIVTGKRITEIDIGRNSELVVLSYPTGDQSLKSRYIEKKALEEAKSLGLLSEEELSSSMLDQFFSAEDQEELQYYTNKVKAYKELLNKRIKDTEVYKSEQAKLREFEKKRQELQNKKSIVTVYSAEYHSRQERFFSLLVDCVSDISGKPIWRSKTEMLDSIGTEENLYSLLNKFLDFYWSYDVPILRKLARSSQWRTMFLGSIKINSSLFSRDMKDLSMVQISLLSWSMWYDSIFEMSSDDRPSEDIINDDDRLEAYMRSLNKKLKSEAENRRSDSSTARKSAKDHDNVIITANSKDYVKFHKDGMYSDTSAITNRVKGEDSTMYSDVDDIKSIKLKNKMLRKANR